MKPLKRLMNESKVLLSEGFLRGAERSLSEEDYEEYIEPFERQIDLTPLDDYLDFLIDEHPPYHSQIDGRLAPQLHRILNLTRREAADMGIWHYLTVIYRPDFVRYRWTYGSREYMKKRFWGVREWDSNTFSRLWWVAEQTHTDGDYSLTEKILTKQYLVRSAFDRDFSRYKPALRAYIAVLGGDPKSVVEEAAKRFNKHLSVVQLENFQEQQIREKFGEIRAEILQDYESDTTLS